jgi:hypothetical protein
MIVAPPDTVERWVHKLEPEILLLGLADSKSERLDLTLARYLDRQLGGHLVELVADNVLYRLAVNGE